MKNKVLGFIAAAVLLSAGICGCRKAPERSAQGDIVHAKDAAEDEVAAIVNEPGGETGHDMQKINCTIGTQGDHAITIRAQMPDVPQDVCHMVLGENEALTKDLLTEFLESETGNVRDISEEAHREAEQSETENERGEERAVFSVFGSAPVCELSDGEKTAGFSYGTGAHYRNERLYETCASVYKSADETVLEEADCGNVYSEIKNLLSAKLSKVGMTEIDVYRVTQYEKGNVAFYEIAFTPSYGGMGVAHEFGSIAAGEIFPLGKAWICEEGIADLSLDACLGKVESRETCGAVLSWGQVEKILETHLNRGTIKGSSRAVLTEVEFLYYPIYKEAEKKLELVPVWHIYTPMSTWMENEELAEAFAEEGAVWNICVNAVSGEIVRSE